MPDVLPALLLGFESVACNYRGFLVDLWGVLHDGRRPYPEALEVLDRVRRSGASVCLLSNSPRRISNVAELLAGMDIGPERYDHLVTSGEMTLEALSNPADVWHRSLGNRYLHLGPDHGFGLLDSLDRELVVAPQAADFVLVTGTEKGQVLADYAGQLAECAALGLPMVCANPDLVVTVAGNTAVCAGTLARHYEALGGSVRYHGKPDQAVYSRCLSELGLGPAALLAIGDSLRTDIAGARAVGMDALFIAGGIHSHELGVELDEGLDPGQIDALLAEYNFRPNFAMNCLRW